MNICLFPGQGNKTFTFDPHSDSYFNQASEILNITKKEILENEYPFKYQLLSLIYNISNFDKLKHLDGAFYNNIDLLIGYSLGEYTSLICSECISFKDCVKLIKIRSELMYKCSVETNSALISIIGISEKYINIIFKDMEYYISIYLSKEGFVLSVNKNDIDLIYSKLNTLKKLHKIYFQLLDVDGGFHSPFMKESSVPFKEYLNTVDFHNPKIKTISNYDGLVYSNINELKQNLTHHLTSPIRWDNIIKNNLNNINKIYEIGGNKLKRTLMLNNIDITNYNNVG
jgi:malonyl CoA-acyl carrier protein transacylase